MIPDPASYRDPSGFVFVRGGIVYRQINPCYRSAYDHLMQSGLYRELVEEGLLVQHEELTVPGDSNDHFTIKPEQIPFLSYASEWSFEMLKDAALLTLNIMRKAMRHRMILKDATPFNIQFFKGRMVFIDTLSFDQYDASEPWIAYRQFCENFLAPLALMHYTKKPLSNLLLAWPEGIPLQTASALLPTRSWFNVHVYLHLHLNATISHAKKKNKDGVQFSKNKLSNILDSLTTAINRFQLSHKGVWSSYYKEASQRENYLVPKKAIIERWLRQTQYATAFDAGANDGEFSKLLASHGIRVISADFEHSAIDQLYAEVKKTGFAIHPLVVDLSNPTPALGVNNAERPALKERLKVDLVMALALIHHLCIGKNIPFAAIARLFADLGKDLIIEFVPKSDEKIREMILHRKDIFDWYTLDNFELAFQQVYQLKHKETVGDSERVLYYWSK